MKTLFAIGEIDNIYIDEHLNRRKHKHLLNKTVKSTIAVVASFLIVFNLMVVLIPTIQKKAGHESTTSNQYAQITMNDLENSNPTINETSSNYVVYSQSEYNPLSEDVYYPMNLGEIRYYGELYDIISRSEMNEDDIYAVRLSGMNCSMLDYTSSNEWKMLYEYEGDCARQEQDHLEKIHGWNYAEVEKCSECANLREETNKAYLERETFEFDYVKKLHLKITEVISQHAKNQGYDAKIVTLIPNYADETQRELSTDYALILHLTKEQLLCFEPSLKLSLVFELIPQWMDTGEEVIYHEPIYRVELE